MSVVPSLLLLSMKTMKAEISDHRDYEISHDLSPHAVRFLIGVQEPVIVGIESSTGKARKARPRNSQSPGLLNLKLHRYLTRWVAYLRHNRQRRILP